MKAFAIVVAIPLFAILTATYAESVTTVNHPDGSSTITRSDANNNPIETSEYKKDGTLSTRTLYERDFEGKVVRTTIQKADSKIKRDEANSYDSKGHLTVTWRTNEDGTVWVRQYSYDEQGNQLKSWVTNAEGKEVAIEAWDRAE